MISVIIPVFNEGKNLPKLIGFLQENTVQNLVEIIIVDGGSTDDTVLVAESLGVKVIQSERKGRAIQMNEGARIAEGEILYFLHADTFPPQNFYKDIVNAVNNNFGAGCYRLSFDDNHPVMRFYCWFTRFDIDLFRFGDQSLFVKKSVFEKVGGYEEKLIVMEDQVIVSDVKKHTRFKILKGKTVTSARKYRAVGRIKLQLIFTLIVIMFYIRVDQHKIVRFYQHQLR